MRSRVKWFLTAVLAAVVIGPAFAQLIPGMIPLLEEGLGAPALLLNKGVQKEIQMTDEQRDKFRKIVRDVHDKYQPDLQKAKTDRDPKKFAKLMLDSTMESREKVNKAIPDVLSDKQIKRLHQIELQVNILPSLNKPEIQKELKFTDKQKTKIKDISDGLKQDIAEAAKGALADTPQRPLEKLRKGAETVQTIKKLTEAASDKALNTLTDEQKSTWKEMTGKKFDFKLDLLNLPGARP
jgi:hypothetical protein